ncbi:MAG: cytochrome c biogenesis protein CcsA [Thermacetogeniaceae bacterium]|nr:cytochrome c biogenesis protein CcsA [Syntrophomonadaceae bacterium]
MEENLVLITFCFYFIAALICLVVLWHKQYILEKMAILCTITGFILLNILLIYRSLLAGRLPGSNLYEFLLLFAWGMSATYLFITIKYKLQNSGVFILPLIIGVLGCAALFSSKIEPLMPALQSPWLKFHVSVAMIGYSVFAVSFALALTSLLKVPVIISHHKGLDDLIYGCNALGFSFLTLVLITGAIWAEQAWGTWWGWDPKETASLVTWLVYGFYLHLRHTSIWSNKGGAILSCLGFFAVIFTLMGITLLVPGLHSYI